MPKNNKIIQTNININFKINNYNNNHQYYPNH
jgi:hypothetical protein